ncbi:uncharacterized protein (TIGR02284 family) [Runella defluvii]|uniref:Uncharacterized protein (TIGR02284 family) n=1 Tax=Runella defluvii TaxID=370973 RepID=A0A7W5ZND9_9BACT|nr:PA2169 family four-helix-bundle protein [Runella defluvii]MBB3839905.1 uncharacterized protein (TIGR02284 family) [Runella defluvii]
MIQNEVITRTLNELLRINNDRLSGYQIAASDTKDEGLKVIFSSMYNESVNFAETLAAYIREAGEIPANEGTLVGILHQAWLNFKAAVVGNDRNGILSSCEFGDEAAIEAYQAALEVEDIQANAEIKGVLLGQKGSIEQSLKVIQSLHHSQAANTYEQETMKLMEE